MINCKQAWIQLSSVRNKTLEIKWKKHTNTYQKPLFIIWLKKLSKPCACIIIMTRRIYTHGAYEMKTVARLIKRIKKRLYAYWCQCRPRFTQTSQPFFSNYIIYTYVRKLFLVSGVDSIDMYFKLEQTNKKVHFIVVYGFLFILNDIVALLLLFWRYHLVNIKCAWYNYRLYTKKIVGFIVCIKVDI